MEPANSFLRMPLENTDLEKRVLAHERVLQDLIAYMARTEPRFIEHLKERFVEPMRMARHEHDHRETEDYAEEFIHAVIRLEAVRAAQRKEPNAGHEQTRVPTGGQESAPGWPCPEQTRGVRIFERHGIWSVITDGKFHGDYCKEEHALAAAALLDMARR